MPIRIVKWICPEATEDTHKLRDGIPELYVALCKRAKRIVAQSITREFVAMFAYTPEEAMAHEADDTQDLPFAGAAQNG